MTEDKPPKAPPPPTVVINRILKQLEPLPVRVQESILSFVTTQVRLMGEAPSDMPALEPEAAKRQEVLPFGPSGT